jgi:hypothetical protein
VAGSFFHVDHCISSRCPQATRTLENLDPLRTPMKNHINLLTQLNSTRLPEASGLLFHSAVLYTLGNSVLTKD